MRDTLEARTDRDVDAHSPGRAALGALQRRMPFLRRTAERLNRWGMTPRGLLIGYAGIHALLFGALLQNIASGAPVGDVTLYREWALDALRGHWPVVDFSWVYPAGALGPIMLSAIAGPGLYYLAWFALMTVGNLGVALVLTDGLKRRGGYPAAWYWLSMVFILSPVSMLRLEGAAAPLVAMAFMLLARRPAIAGALLAAGAWIKVFPIAAAVAAVVTSSRRVLVAIGGIALTAAIALAVFAAGGGTHLFSFLSSQTERAFQLEAPAATPWVWGEILGLPGYAIYWNTALVTYEVRGPNALRTAGMMDYFMLVAFALAIVGLAFATDRIRRSGVLGESRTRAESHLVLVGAFLLTAALIVFNKVGSPQYVLWLLPVVTAGIALEPGRWKAVARVMQVVALLTTLVFPTFYLQLVAAEPFAAAILAARNVLLVVLFVWSGVALIRAAVRPRFVPAPVSVATGPLRLNV